MDVAADCFFVFVYLLFISLSCFYTELKKKKVTTLVIIEMDTKVCRHHITLCSFSIITTVNVSITDISVNLF